MSCGKRPTHADLRLNPELSMVMPCVESDQHRGDHVNEEGQTWAQHGSRGSDRPRGLGQSARPMNQVSEKQQGNLDRWAFIKRCMILAQRRTDGYTSCMRCGRRNPPKLELHHIEYAGRGGEWEPENGELLCAGFEGSCHSVEHGEPQFAGSAS